MSDPDRTARLTIALAQLNPLVGDIASNTAKAEQARAAVPGADLIVFSELFLCGYPPEDLVLKPAFEEAVAAAAQDLARQTADGGPAVLMGVPWRDGNGLHNAVALMQGGRITDLRFKNNLPNYGVFDEKRLFQKGPKPDPIRFKGISLGVPICEDIWAPEVCRVLKERGAELLIAVNGSPFHTEKQALRKAHAGNRVHETGLPLIYVNQVGGQDELIFDGASFAIGTDGALACQLPDFSETVAETVWEHGPGGWQCTDAPVATLSEGPEAAYRTAMLGLKDYIEKNRFPGVVLGLSGGIDSALTAAICADALGPERVHCVMLPSDYTSQESLEDAAACAAALGVRLDTVPIVGPVNAFADVLAPLFEGREADITEENIQSRARGLILMALSNKFGSMVITTGNKSEVAVGYSTLYGDMCGGYNPLKDLYKTEVFALARWRNGQMPEGGLGPEGGVIPERIIAKPPTAELRPDQKDEDSLPPYEVLDDILHCLVDHDMDVDATAARGHDRETVARIEHMVFVAEYKRRQAAPGAKIGVKLFGRDRRYPITNGFRDATQPARVRAGRDLTTDKKP